MIKQNSETILNKKDNSEALSPLVSLDNGSKSKLEKNKMTNRKNDKSRGRVEIVTDLCKGCLLCIEACPPEVLIMSDNLNKMGYHPVEYVGDGCTSCGICYYICPELGTISVYKRVKSNKA